MYLHVNVRTETVRQKARLNNLMKFYRVPANNQILLRVGSQLNASPTTEIN